MTKKQKTQTKPFSLRFTYEERAKLEERAGKKSLGIFIRSKLFNENDLENRKEVFKGRTETAKILGMLGQSDLGKNLKQLSQAAKSGSLIVTPDTEGMLDRALKDIILMKASQRGGARQLAAHLTNEEDNQHVVLYDIRGFVSDDLDGALLEAHSISKATQCKQFMFSICLSPPPNEDVPPNIFESALE